MSFETGKIGRQAGGAVVARIEDTIVYSTACADRTLLAVDFTPLRADFFARYRYQLFNNSSSFSSDVVFCVVRLGRRLAHFIVVIVVVMIPRS
jgi:hypothetical protein